MKAWVIQEFGGSEVMKLEEIPLPKVQANEVLIKSEYVGTNPVDWKIREGLIQSLAPFAFSITLGWDVAGVVEKVGSNVSHLHVGDLVYAFCRRPTIHAGTYAEYVAFDAKDVALKPSNLTMAEAASLPLVALTAWQSLYNFSNLAEGDKVFIHAGAGGVGSIAIQLAKHVKAHVITTTSGKNFDYVKSLGADEVIDYTKEDFVEKIQESHPEGIDVVFDCVGGKSFHQSLQLIKKGGSLVSICNLVDESYGAEVGVKTGFVFVEPSGKELALLARLIEEGALFSPHMEEYPFTEAAAALDKLKEGHTRGKIVLKVV